MGFEDESMVKIMQSLGLDYGPAERATKSFESKIASLNKQLFDLRANAVSGAKNINQVFSSQLGQFKSGSTIFDQFGQPLKTIQTEAEKTGKSYDETIGKINKSTGKIKQPKIPKPDDKEFNLWADQWQRRSQWFLSGTIFYGVINGAGAAVKEISNVEMGITQIARVMEDTSFNFRQFRDDLIGMGVDYGQNFNNVQDIAERWAQAGYNVKDTLDNTKISLLALNSAELDAKQATEDMIGIMSQWQLTSKDLPLLLDKINKTADDFTVTSQDLVDGLLRSSGAAKIMGMSIDQTISLLTVMREASGRTGREVGNALNSILSYVQRPSAINTFEDLGIQVFADKAKTQFRNVMDIFQDVAAKWPTLSKQMQDGFVKAADDAGLYNEELANAIGVQQEWNDLQQRDLSQASAGVYRRNYFIGMIERLSGAQKVLNNMTDAAGYSEAENARTMDTLAKKYEAMKAAATQLAVNLGDSGLTAVLKGLADGATFAITEFSKLPKPVQDGVLAFAGMFTVLKAGQQALKLFGITSTANAASAKVAAAAMNTMTEATVANAAATEAATVASKGFLAANKWFLIIAGAASVISILAGIFSKHDEAQKKFIEDTKKNIETLTEQKQGLQQLTNEYEALKDKQQSLTATTDEKQRLLEVEQELVEKYGVSITGINAEGKAYSDNIELIKLRTKAIQDQIAAEEKSLKNAVLAQDNDRVSKVKELQETINLNQKRLDLENKALEYASKTGVKTVHFELNGDMIPNDEAVKRDSQTMINRNVDNIARSATIYEGQLKTAKDELSTITKDFSQTLQNDADNILKTMESKGSKVSDSARLFISEYAKSLSTGTDDLYTAEDALGKFISDLSSSDFEELEEKYNKFKADGDTQGIDKTSEAILNLVHTFSKGKPELDRLMSTFEKEFGNSEAIKKAAESGEAFNNVIDKMSDKMKALNTDGKQNTESLFYQYKQVTDSVSDLDSAINTLNQGQQLSAETITEIMAKHEGLRGKLVEVNGVYTLRLDVLKSVRDSEIDAQTAAFQSANAIKDNEWNILKERLAQYGIYYSTLQEMQNAFNKDNNVLDDQINEQIASAGRGGRYWALQDLYGLKESTKTFTDYFKIISDMDKLKKNVGSGVGTSSKSSSSSSSTNKQLQDALSLLDHKKRLNQISLEDELAYLEKIKALYAKSAEDRMEMEEKIYDVQQQLKDKALERSKQWISEQKELGKLSLDDEIAAWTRVLENQKDNINAVKEAQKGLFDAYKKLLGEQQDNIKDAYDERIKLIEKEEKALEESEAEHDYNNEMKDLQDKLAYWKVRTSEEARKNVADIEKEIAEKQHDHEVDTKKAALEQEKQDWETALDQMNDAFNDHNLDILARMASTSKEAYQLWVDNYLNPLMAAMKSGNLDAFKNITGGLGSSISELGKHDYGMSEQDYSTFVANGQAYASADTELRKKLNAENDALRKKYGIPIGEYPKFHTGGEVAEDGALVAKKGELIFPTDLSTDLRTIIAFAQNGAFKGNSVSHSSSTTDNRRQIKIDKLLNIENNYMEDDVDAGITARELKRAILSIK